MEFGTESYTNILSKWMQGQVSFFFLTILLLAPSYKFIFLAYVPIYSVNMIYMLWTYTDPNTPHFFEMLMLQPANFTFALIAFAVFQNRELKRFFEQKSSNQKSEELMGVLNA